MQHARAGNGRFFGYVLGSGEPIAALADFYVSVLNQNVTAWRSAPSTITVERTVIGWLTQAIGCHGSLRGKFALRACIVNHRTTDDDFAAIVEEVLAVAEQTA